MGNRSALLIIYSFSDMRPQADALLKAVELLSRKFPDKKLYIKYKLENGKSSGLKLLTPDLQALLHKKAGDGKLFEFSMQDLMKDPSIKY